ncbi:MAG: VWA domain-containing protein [Chitinophagales bacterium]
MKFFNLSAIALLFTFLMFGSGCNLVGGKDDDTITCPLDNSKDLVLTIQDQFVSLPSSVSVFFKVDDKNDKPIPQLTSDNFVILEKGRNDDCARAVSSFEANSKIRPHSQIFTFNTILILDLSASVTATSLSELKEAAKSFIDQVQPENVGEAYRMSIRWFDGEDKLHLLQDFTHSNAKLKAAVESITANISSDPSTDLYGAVIKGVVKAQEVLVSYQQQDIISAVSMVIFTDGTDQAARHSKQDALNAVNNNISNVTTFTIGLGEEIDETVLKQIGRDGSFFAADKEELEAIFNEIAQLISSEANSYYLFEYCSPKRDGSGMNELRIEATSGNLKGSVTTTFDAAGFTSGCQ